MGTWDTRTFDNDLALEWLKALGEQPTVEFLQATLEAPDSGYLMGDTCVNLLAAAEIVSSVLNGPREGLPDEALAIIESLSRAEVEPLRKLAGEKARGVLSERSALRGTWSRAEDLFPEWQDGVLDLCRRLDG
jgi:Domain of unknown function (DUF4259)